VENPPHYIENFPPPKFHLWGHLWFHLSRFIWDRGLRFYEGLTVSFRALRARSSSTRSCRECLIHRSSSYDRVWDAWSLDHLRRISSSLSCKTISFRNQQIDDTNRSQSDWSESGRCILAENQVVSYIHMKIRWCWVTWSKILSIFHFIAASHHSTYLLSFSISCWSCFQFRIIWAFRFITKCSVLKHFVSLIDSNFEAFRLFSIEAFRFIKRFKFWSISSLQYWSISLHQAIQYWSISLHQAIQILKHFVSSCDSVLKHFVSSSDSSNDSNLKHFVSHQAIHQIWSISLHISLRSRFDIDHWLCRKKRIDDLKFSWFKLIRLWLIDFDHFLSIFASNVVQYHF
jgi:hypothetical protein